MNDERKPGKGKAIMIHGGYITVQAARALGKYGIKSIVLYADETEPALVSKYVTEKVKISSYLNEKEILSVLLHNVNRWRGAIFIPCNDESVLLLSKNKKLLEKYYSVPLCSNSVLRKLVDKSLTYQLAEKAGISFPRTFYFRNLRDLEANKAKLIFPLLLKPCERHFFYEKFRVKLFEVHDYETLKSKFEECMNLKLKMMVTELIPGNDTYLHLCKFYVDKGHRVISTFGMQKMRQAPPNYGVGRVMLSERNTEVERLTKKLIATMPEFQGVAQTEFKYDQRDGKYKLIEVNARNTLFVGLEENAGLNLPYLMYQEFVLNKKLEPIPKLKTGVYWIMLYRDLFYTFSKQRRLENYGFWDYIKPYLRRKVFALESLADPKPMVKQWKQVFFALFWWALRKIGFSHGPRAISAGEAT